MNPETGFKHRQLAVDEAERIGLDRLETSRDRLARQRRQIGERLDAGLAEAREHVAKTRAKTAAMRPVEIKPVAERPAEQRANRHAQRLRLDVEAGVLDGGDGLIVEPASGETRQGMQGRGNPADRARVHADDKRLESAQQIADAADAEPFRVFGPADKTIVGRDLEKGQSAPTGVRVKVFQLDDFHAPTPIRPRATAHRSPARCRARFSHATARGCRRA